jgi:hypothetical protein
LTLEELKEISDAKGKIKDGLEHMIEEFEKVVNKAG